MMKQSISKKLRKSSRKQRKSVKKHSSVKKQSVKKQIQRKSVKKHTRVNNRRLRLYKKGGGIIPSSVSQLGYSVMGTGQSIVDGWNGKPSSFAYVNPSPEHQIPANNGYYTGNHGVV